jgi:tryptophan-rich sensory protein
MNNRLKLLTLAIIFLVVEGAASFHLLAPSPTLSKSTSWIRQPSVAIDTSTKLEAIPSWTFYSIGHIIGGTTGTPIVIRATKTWYKRIALPSWTPPNFVFAPVWTLLYGLMGISVSRIMKSNVANTSVHDAAKILWGIHYALNLLWAPTFFGLKYLRMGQVINYFLLSTLGVTLSYFHRIDSLAAYLQIPYFLWLIYATILNQAICKLNPTVDGTNTAMIQADLCAFGPGYNDAMLQFDIKILQSAAAKYAGCNEITLG